MEELDLVKIMLGIVSPLYALIIWRIKVSVRTEKKVDKIITVMKIEHPERASLFD